MEKHEYEETQSDDFERKQLLSFQQKICYFLHANLLMIFCFHRFGFFFYASLDLVLGQIFLSKSSIVSSEFE